LLESGRPQEALAASQELEKSRWAMGRFAGHFVGGASAAGAGTVWKTLGTSLALAEQEMEQLPAQVIKSLQDTVMLRAEIMLREKNWDKRQCSDAAGRGAGSRRTWAGCLERSPLSA